MSPLRPIPVFLLFVSPLLLASLAMAEESRAVEKPNVVLIISDDHAWTDYGFQDHPQARTPNIDQLAKTGLTFTRGYVTTALCSPSLATILTGLYPHQHGITGNDPVPGQPRSAWLDRFVENEMLPQLLADAGYLTLHTGKLWTQSPARVGFTDDMGPTGRHGAQALEIGRKSMEPIDQFIDKANKEEKPFFVWYAPFLPHTPHNPPERLLQKYADIKDRKVANYLAMVEWFDETCGELVGQLEEKGVADNTLILYLADNGWNENGKGFPYENGVRTPVILRWPA
ncbi:MAG: sulfatase-like hydrolase/transferase, partial [Planctomycetales bacterium]